MQFGESGRESYELRIKTAFGFEGLRRPRVRSAVRFSNRDAIRGTLAGAPAWTGEGACPTPSRGMRYERVVGWIVAVSAAVDNG